MSAARRKRPNALIPGLGLSAMIVAVMALYFFNMEAINAILALPYLGLGQGAVALKPQITFHLAMWLLAAVVGAAVVAIASRLFFGADGVFPRKFVHYWLGALGLTLALFALSRFDYWVVYPDRLVVQRPWGQAVRPMSDIRSVEVGCRTIKGSRGPSYDIIYRLRFDHRGFDIANTWDFVLPNKLDAVLTRIEGLQPRLLAQGTPYRGIGVTEHCLSGHAAQLGPGGEARLALIGVHR